MGERNLWELEAAARARGYRSICGCDEAGAGPLAGPVYAAAVILPEGLVLPGLDDSKKVAPKRREALFDAICDQAGIARCRTADVEALRDQGSFDLSGLRALHRSMGIDVLVPDRFAFAQAFPALPVDRASIEDYMTLMLKGAAL